ncbi:hypothetical protein HQI21_26760, partial [Escherichia coli]|nr:hypothetical protein [Escherichia coli]
GTFCHPFVVCFFCKPTYTATYYNIKYDSSLNLQASDGKIHKNYNRWVRNLDKDIQVNLSTGATL